MQSEQNRKVGKICSERAWVVYRLQSMPPSQLAKVVNRILRGDDSCLNPLEREKSEKSVTSDIKLAV